MQLTIGKCKPVTVADLAEASRLWGEYRDGRDLGSSASPAVTVTDDQGRVLHVSYNGRVWANPSRDYQPGDKPIYCPSQWDQVS